MHFQNDLICFKDRILLRERILMYLQICLLVSPFWMTCCCDAIWFQGLGVDNKIICCCCHLEIENSIWQVSSHNILFMPYTILKRNNTNLCMSDIMDRFLKEIIKWLFQGRCREEIYCLLLYGHCPWKSHLKETVCSVKAKVASQKQ